MLENPEGHPAVPAPGSFFLYEWRVGIRRMEIK